MRSHYTNNLLNLEDVLIKKVVHGDHFVRIFIETEPSLHLPFQMKDTYLVLKKRRYACKCGKKFIEKYPFLPSYQRPTLRLSYKIIDQLRNLVSIKSVAETTNVSVSTVTRLLYTVNYTPHSLPECLSIDEFKGNTDAGKFQCILTDAKKHRIFDILPDRTQHHLSNYFRNINRAERHRVKFFVCDMWEPYVDLAKAYFPNATIIIDKYHLIRYVTWAIENVRKRLQKTMPTNLRKYYKRSLRLILTRYHKLKEEN